MRILVTSLLMLTTGCALILNTPPPSGRVPPGENLACTDHYAAPIVDIVLGIVAAGTGTLGVAVGSQLGDDDGRGMVYLGAVGVVGGVVHFVSAGVGIHQVGECRDHRGAR